MNVTKYRKWYLSENWGHNRFRMIEYYVDFFENHPKVLSGQGYWLTLEKMCIGYEMDSNPEIYRPIFSHKRQRLLNNIHLNIINPYIFWNNIKLKIDRKYCNNILREYFKSDDLLNKNFKDNFVKTFNSLI